MGAGRDIVVTVYGHDKTIDKIAVSTFDKPDNLYGPYGYMNNSDAITYCDALNSLELNGNSWVFAKIISEYAQYTLDSFLPLKFDIIWKLDDRTIQKVLRAVDSREIAMALKGEKEAVMEKVFSNMSERVAQMVKEDMECMGSIRKIDVNKSREKIIDIIRRLEETGEIVISYDKGETIE